MTSHIVKSPQLLKNIRDKLLSAALPSNFASITIDAIHSQFAETDSSFFEFLQLIPSQFDILLGKVEEASSPDSLLIATAAKLHLLRIAKPSFPSFYFDKSRLWEKNILPPHEIIQLLQENLSSLLANSTIQVPLFYGRIDLEYNIFTYVNCGFNKFVHCKPKHQEYKFLESHNLPLSAHHQNSFHSQHMLIHQEDSFIFYFEDSLPFESIFQQYFRPILEKYHYANASELITYVKKYAQELGIKKSELENSPITILKVHQFKQDCFPKMKMAKFKADLSQLQAARIFVQHLCKELPGDAEKMTSQLQLVINEILCNIIKHGYLHAAKDEIMIESQTTKEGIFVTISDKGDSFDPLKVKYPNLTGEEDRGFGLFIIEQIIDHMSYFPKSMADEWNHLYIFKRYFSEEE